MSTPTGLDGLRQTLQILLSEEGCEWDREQTHASLVNYLIEEVYELVDAIESGDRQALREELGDVLYQILFHAEIARREGSDPFDIDDVAEATSDKMRRRHPHVFAGVQVRDVEQIRANWQAQKRLEKPQREGPLDGVPRSMQGISRAHHVLDRAAQAGHPAPAGSPLPSGDEGELGRWLLGLIASARAEGLDLDRALRQALAQFEAEVVASPSDGVSG